MPLTRRINAQIQNRHFGTVPGDVVLGHQFSVSCSRRVAPSDDAITKDIKARMSSEPLLKDASINVTTHGQVVTLSGQVPDDSEHLAAYDIAIIRARKALPR